MTAGSGVRAAYLRTLDIARTVVAAPEVAASWDAPSVLAELSVRGLAGHLTRAGTLVEQYLDAGFPAEVVPVADAAEYYEVAAAPSDPAASVNVAIRDRGEEAAAGGHAAVVMALDDARERLAARLAAEPADGRIAVTGGMLLGLDEYLVTRIVELVTHTDDLAVSVGLPTPDPDPRAATLAVDCLVTLGRRRHGDVAVVRALTRRERDAVGALRAF